MFELLITDGKVVNGIMNPWFRADIGIEDGKITSIGKLKGSRSDREIDAHKKIVSPGFIDTHSHSDLMLLVNPKAEQKIMQGVTTELLGQDGISAAPINDDFKGVWRRGLSGLLGDPEIDWGWSTIKSYLKRFEKQGTAVNVATLVPHGNLRLLAMDGVEDRKAGQDETDEMRLLLVEQSLKEGAYGTSTGLIYPPCCYADTEELIDLAKTTAEKGGFFVFHMRSEGDKLLEAIGEVILIGESSGCAIHISHFKAKDRRNWDKVKDALKLLEDARERGLDVTCDQYPYIAGSTMLSSLIPQWVHVGGSEALLRHLKSNDVREKLKRELEGTERDLEMVSYCKNEGNRRFVGKTIKEISTMKGNHPVDALCDLLIEENLDASRVNFYGCEEDVEHVMKSHLQMFCTDGLLPGRPHPRVYGTYPRILGRYVRERGVLSLEEAVRKMTSLPAQRIGLKDRGIIRIGMAADITIFDPEVVIDKAIFDDPVNFPDGIEYTIVNGKIVNDKGHHTGELPGKVLKKRH